MDVYVARQPIFDRNKAVVGYELLHRTGLTLNSYQGDDDTKASLAVIRSAFLFLGERILPRPRKAYINFTKDLLLSGIARMLPHDSTVIEVQEDIDADDELVSACMELKEEGYSIALTDFTLQSKISKLLIDIADVVKVNVSNVDDYEIRAIVSEFGERKKLIAKGVETESQFTSALARGFSGFQGYFFSKPIIIPGKDIPAHKLNYVRILEELNKPELDLRALETIIKRDTSLCYTLLRYINSAYFGFRDKISSVLQALVFLGDRQVRKWACLVLFTFLGVDRPPEVVVRSLIRGRMCELLAEDFNVGGKESELFLMGMFSLLDVLIGRPLEDVLEGLSLGADVSAALLRGEGRYGEVYRLVLSYEVGNWERLSEILSHLSIDPEHVLETYVSAVSWADEVTTKDFHQFS
jgi:c-di-GMP-related signal transduction protein